MKLAYLVLAFLVALVMPSVAQDAGPFGLAWGMSREQVQAIGVELATPIEAPEGTYSLARKLPKALVDLDQVALYFGNDNKLWRVFAVSKDWSNDAYGASVIKRVDELRTLLTQRYGKGKFTHSKPDDSFYSDPSKFAYSLSQKERFYFEVWKANGVSIELSARSKLSDTFYVLIYENDELATSARRSVQSTEKDAL